MLALGNCMADWVADSVVARSGNIQMAFAACFGSPMLSHVLGLSVAFIVSGSRSMQHHNIAINKLLTITLLTV